jgi:hypothetical protein
MDLISLLFLLILIAMVAGFVVAVIRGKRTEHGHEGKGGDPAGWIPGMNASDAGGHQDPFANDPGGRHGEHGGCGSHHGGAIGDAAGGHHH